MRDDQKFCEQCGASVPQWINDPSLIEEFSSNQAPVSPTPQMAPEYAPPQQPQKKTNGGLIAILVVGAILMLVVVILAGNLIYRYVRNSKAQETYNDSVYDQSNDWDNEPDEDTWLDDTESYDLDEDYDEDYDDYDFDEDTEDTVSVYGNEEDQDYILPMSSDRALTDEDLEDIKDDPWLLRVARNEIFARYGRMFNDEDLQAYFDSKDWYEPTYTPEEFDENTMVSRLELDNADFIKQYENRLK